MRAPSFLRSSLAADTLLQLVRRRRALRILIGGATMGACVLAWQGLAQGQAEKAVPIAPPAQDLPAAGTTETAVLAGGCFWGVQGVFQHVQGVKRVVSGYAGGAADTAFYERVGRGDTGHAESVQITYDPRQVSYGALLQIFFSVAHDPTEVDRQGPDTGPQYRSAIFPRDDAQRRVASAYIAQLNAARAFKRPIATRVETGKSFYPAEDYHQDFLVRNPRYPYIVINDLPKIAQLKQAFPQRWRAEPVLARAEDAAPRK
jgi:peptide-methionine (S)-S-oxide reductase